MPLVFTLGQRVITADRARTLYHQFSAWRNAFVYSDPELAYSGVADGARTTDDSGYVVAEAKLSRLIRGEAVEVEEFHYDSAGGITFHCKSRYSLTSGLRDAESETQGKRESDYYPFWPVKAVLGSP